MPTYSIAILGFMRVVPLTHLTPLLDGRVLEGFWNGITLVCPMRSAALSTSKVTSLQGVVLKAIGRPIGLSQSLQD